MSLISEAERILGEEAARVVALGEGGGRGADAARRGGALGGAALGGLVGGPAGAALGASVGGAAGAAGLDWLTGASADTRREMRQAARRVAGRCAELLGAEVQRDIDTRGMSALFDAIAGNARITRWSDVLPDIRQLRGVPRGEGQRAAGIYMDAAAPGSRVSVPQRIARSDAWRILSGAWGDFSAVVGRFVAVMAAYDGRGLPDPAAGARALQRAYPEQWAQLERSARDDIFGATGQARQSAQSPPRRWREVPSWASPGMPQGLQSINPETGRPWIQIDGWGDLTEAMRVEWLQARGLPVEYAYADGEARFRARTGTKKTKRSGGAIPLVAGVLAVTGIGVAAATRTPRPKMSRKKKKSRRGARR